jgi:hypothetical protein
MMSGCNADAEWVVCDDRFQGLSTQMRCYSKALGKCN